MRASMRWYWAGSLRRRSVIGVTIGPGWTELARMASRAYCSAVSFVRSRTAPLEAEYWRSEEHTSELQSQSNLVCRLLLEKKKTSAPQQRPSAPLERDL